MSITKRELVVRLSRKHGLQQRLTRDLVQSFLDEIVASLAQGERLEFREFGIFHLQHKNARIARNPRTGETFEIPERNIVHFKPGLEMKERVARTPNRKEAVKLYPTEPTALQA
jgi:integration host factor subunit beta